MKLGVIGIRSLEMGRGPVGDRKNFFNRSPASLIFNLLIPFTQRIGHDTAHTLPSRMGDRLSKAVRFRSFTFRFMWRYSIPLISQFSTILPNCIPVSKSGCHINKAPSFMVDPDGAKRDHEKTLRSKKRVSLPNGGRACWRQKGPQPPWQTQRCRALERRDDGKSGRIGLEPIRCNGTEFFDPLVPRNSAVGTTIFTDGNKAYQRILSPGHISKVVGKLRARSSSNAYTALSR